MADKKRKTTLLQYEDLFSLRSSIVARIRSRLSANPQLGSEINTRMDTFKQEAKTDINDFYQKAKNALKIRGGPENRSGIKANSAKKTAKKVKKDKNDKKEKKDKKKTSKRAKKESSDDDDDDAEDECSDGGEVNNYAESDEEEHHDAHAGDDGSEGSSSKSDSEATYHMRGPWVAQAKHKAGQPTPSLSVVSGKDGLGDDSDLWNDPKFTPPSGKTMPTLSDDLIEMLSEDVHQHFKLSSDACSDIGQVSISQCIGWIIRL